MFTNDEDGKWHGPQEKKDLRHAARRKPAPRTVSTVRQLGSDPSNLSTPCPHPDRRRAHAAISSLSLRVCEHIISGSRVARSRYSSCGTGASTGCHWEQLTAETIVV